MELHGNYYGGSLSFGMEIILPYDADYMKIKSLNDHIEISQTLGFTNQNEYCFWGYASHSRFRKSHSSGTFTRPLWNT